MIKLNQKSLKKWQDDKLEHLRYEYNLKPDDYLIDVGSYQKEWANEMIWRYGVEVECFEALDNRAAWTHNGTLQMGGRFYYTSMHDHGELGSVRTVNCVDIAPFLQREVAVLKINIEGGEYELIQYIIDCGLIENIRNLQVQFHLVDGMNCQQLYNKLFNQLCKTHQPTWIFPFCWENWRKK